MIGIGMRRSTGAVGACVAVVALLAGCGGSAGESSSPGGSAIAGLAPVEIARNAPDVTRAAGTSRYAVDMTYTSTGGPVPGLDAPMTMTGTGTYDFANQIGDGEYTSSGGGLPSEQLETVFRNNVLWQRAAGQTRWQEIDYSDLVDTPIGQHDPSQQLDLLRGVSDDVRELGTTELRGAEVRHYAISIDPVRLSQESGVVVEDGLMQAALGASGPIPAEVFVDEDGRVRRLQMGISVSGADLAASPEMAEAMGDVLDDPRFAEMLAQRRTEMQISVEYFDFGIPVTAQVPDPSTVDQGPSIPGPR
jgi:hypothetical protein